MVFGLYIFACHASRVRQASAPVQHRAARQGASLYSSYFLLISRWGYSRTVPPQSKPWSDALPSSTHKSSTVGSYPSPLGSCCAGWGAAVTTGCGAAVTTGVGAAVGSGVAVGSAVGSGVAVDASVGAGVAVTSGAAAGSAVAAVSTVAAGSAASPFFPPNVTAQIAMTAATAAQPTATPIFFIHVNFSSE